MASVGIPAGENAIPATNIAATICRIEISFKLCHCNQ
jgi:hypothetical protein